MAASRDHSSEPSDITNGEDFSTIQVTIGFLGTALHGFRELVTTNGGVPS